MTIPKFVKVLGLQFEIVHDADVARQGDCHGSMHSTAQKIFLDPSNTPQNQEEIFLHELLHAIFWKMGLHQLPSMDSKIEEQIIHAMASGLSCVFKDNGMLK